MLHGQILTFRIIFVYKCASEPTYASKALVQIKKNGGWLQPCAFIGNVPTKQAIQAPYWRASKEYVRSDIKSVLFDASHQCMVPDSAWKSWVEMTNEME